jgi:hypothetical protein
MVPAGFVCTALARAAVKQQFGHVDEPLLAVVAFQLEPALRIGHRFCSCRFPFRLAFTRRCPSPKIHPRLVGRISPLEAAKR